MQAPTTSQASAPRRRSRRRPRHISGPLADLLAEFDAPAEVRRRYDENAFRERIARGAHLDRLWGVGAKHEQLELDLDSLGKAA